MERNYPSAPQGYAATSNSLAPPLKDAHPIDSLNAELKLLANAVDAMEDRLSQFLVQVPTSPGPSQVTPRLPNSSFRSQLLDNVEQVQAIRRRLLDLKDRIDL